MKIIQANKFFYPKGGADKYFLELISRLEENGDTVIPFAMAGKDNQATPWASYFSDQIDYHRASHSLKAAWRLIWNRPAAKKFARLLDATKPDLIHVHNIYHQLSPSILAEAKKRKIPVVMTLHDYKLLCPNYLMFTHGHNCRRCLRGNYWPCLINNCYQSYPRSALAALESFWHNRVWHIYRETVDLFIAPSQYLKSLMVSAGWPAERIIVLTNPAPDYNPQPDGQRLLYVGRLSSEKGGLTLIAALAQTDDQLDIVGAGREEKNWRQLVAQYHLEKRIAFHGFLSGAPLEEFKKKAKAIVLPSLWAENMPLVLLEALAYGKLVVASDSGGTRELINEKTGFLFPPGNQQSLAQRLQKLNAITPPERQALTENIKNKITPLNWKNHLAQLHSIYQKVLTQNKNR